MNLSRHFGRTLWTGDRPIAWLLPIRDSTENKNKWIYNDVCTGIQTHDSNFRAVQDITRFRPHGHLDRVNL